MWRFIVCSFAFMGWGFYELSGGSEFEPETQTASIFAPMPDSGPETGPASTAEPATVQTAEATQPQVVLASLTTRAEPLSTLDTTSLVDTAKADVVAAPVVEPETVEVVASVQEAVQEQATVVETRFVKPNRVNVRGGPGTDYNIVAKLIKNDEVTILGDNGDGWYEIETIDGQIGWMADFLLVASN